MKLILIIGLMVSSQAFGSTFGDCDLLFPKKAPPKISQELNKDSKALCFNDFAVLYSVKTKTPIYTVQKMNYLQRTHKEKRKDNFHEEMRLKPHERSTLADYKNSGYDRGHQVPAADCTNSLCMSDSFSLSNMIPQNPSNNRGLWAKSVEKATRKYVERASGDIYVFTGGFYGDNPKTIGKNKVAVPTHIWKLVFDSQKNKSWVFWVENTAEAKMSAPISYEEFVKKTGLRLLD